MKAKTPPHYPVSGKSPGQPGTGQLVDLEGERFVLIDHLEKMPDFFLSMVSADDHWLFASTNGALSAGRESPDSALFPYYTVDKITNNWNCTGPQTIICCNGQIWEPFKPHSARHFPVARRIYKSLNGDSVIFEETNKQLDLCYRYRWHTSRAYGFVRTVDLANTGQQDREIRIVDGIADILPSGIDARTQLNYSCLVDAYRLSELDSSKRLLVHRMAASLIDEAVPLECLLATTVWSVGWPESDILLRLEDAHEYMEKPVKKPYDPPLRATPGAYFNAGQLHLPAGQSRQWAQVADVNRSQSEVAGLSKALEDPEALFRKALEDIDRGRNRLEQLIAAADGQQVSQDAAMTTHHRANVLYNIMRGGVFRDSYRICPRLLREHVGKHQRTLDPSGQQWLDSLPEDPLTRAELLALAEKASPGLRRTCAEYLPLVFSRRHGDPSRPWNRFSTKTTDEHGNPVVGFQGNWRDIFQNWEALAWSFPHYNQAFIHKFLNASTADGYNPYRITSEGFEWEEPDEEDPWASIGYWGDHQIVYLLKLLEFEENLDPASIASQLDSGEYVFADVPYEIKSHEELEQDPKHSIHFNKERNKQITARAESKGTDGKLVHRPDGSIQQATLLEKLLLPALVKLGNLVPGGGIWMNTQRPEWNDANNALAGHGLSVVTTGYLHRYILFLQRQLKNREDSFPCFHALAGFHRALSDALATEPAETTSSDEARLKALRQFGHAGEDYRQRIYRNDFGGSETLQAGEVRTLLERARRHLVHTIRLSRRPDALYHAYNILHLEENHAAIGFLDPILEGQVAALSSQAISTEDALAVLQALPDSPLHCPHRGSYLLYPDKQLPRFLDFNKVPAEDALAIPLLARMREDGDCRLLSPSEDGCMRFNPQIRNRFELDHMLDKLAAEKPLRESIEAGRAQIHQLYEDTFKHKAFTGRSGSMFSYEGLGCIYWHMVSKLMLAALEVTLEAGDNRHFSTLAQHYYGIQDGLGFRKTAAQYGAFPADAYSHTPSHSGASQPGLTGMVKEGILCRFHELGLAFRQGCIRFRPSILRAAELTSGARQTEIIRADGSNATMEIPEQALLFTLAQTPVIYRRSPSGNPSIEIRFRDGSQRAIDSDTLDPDLSDSILHRRDQIDHLLVQQPANRFIETSKNG